MVVSDSADAIRLKQKADTLLKSGDYTGAIQLYMKAIELDPNYEAAWNNMAYSFFRQGKINEAIRCQKRREELSLLKSNGNSGINLKKEIHNVIDRGDLAGEPPSNSSSNTSKFLSDVKIPSLKKSLKNETRIPEISSNDQVVPIRNNDKVPAIYSANLIETGRTQEKAIEEPPLPERGSEIPGEQVDSGLSRWRSLISPTNRSTVDIPLFYPLFFFIIIILFAYTIPLFISSIPSGSDVYFHMVSTDRMYHSESLVDFIIKSFYQEYLGFDYPFGMWYFGAIVMKITGISVIEMVTLLPMLLIFISFVVYYVYANKLLRKKEWAVISLIFLISMPLLAINMLNFQTSRFISVFLVMILLIIVDEKKKWQNLPLLMAIPFIMAITHTGTYMFLVFFSTSYLILYALLWKKFDWWMFLITVTTLFMYVIAVQQFQFVQPQYVDKGRLIISVTDNIASFTNVDIIRDMGSIFYDNIFVTNNMSYVIFWSAMIFSAGMIAIWLHRKMENQIHSFRAIPLLGSLSNISHSIITTPFWMGPVQSILSIVGIFLLEPKGKCIFLAILISAVLPASMQSDVGTGALRQIYYLFLIIPVTAAAGMMVIYPKIIHWCKTPKKKTIPFVFLILIILPSICAPIVGNIYYVPKISGTVNERENLIWLGTVGNKQDGVADYAYRERIDVYAQKETPDISQGMDTRRYLNNLRSVYFSSGSEMSVAELYSSNIHYLISSERILSAFNARSDALRIDSNTMLEKIFSSDNQFGFYQVNTPSSKQIPISVNESLECEGVQFHETPVTITDAITSYVIESPFYKVRLSKAHPSVLYLGTTLENMLGEGVLKDQIIVTYWRGSDNKRVILTFSDFNSDSVIVSGNTIKYMGTIKSDDKKSDLATIQVIYTFLEKAMRVEVRVANDLSTDLSTMNLMLGTSITSPATRFDYLDLTDEEETEVSRRIYPSQDTISIRDIKTNRIFLNQQGKGILLYYYDSSPYPDRVLYKGSEVNNYGYLYAQSDYPLSQGDVCYWVRYITVGEKQATIRNIEGYTSVSVHDYPEGIIPLVVISPNYFSGWIGEELNYPVPKSNLSLYNTKSAGSIKDYLTQLDEIAVISRENQAKGIISPNLQYNLDTIKAVSDNRMGAFIGFPVNPPFQWLFKEGRRNLKEAYYHGYPSGVILVPVSLHQSGVIGRGYDIEDLVKGWTNTIDTVVEDGGIAVFFWDPQDFASQHDLEKLNSLMSYADSKGVRFVSLDSLIEHKLLLNNIAIKAEKDIDTVVLEMRNNNPESVNGFTIKVRLPEIEKSCQYQVSEGGRIARVDSEAGLCIMYVSCDLAPGEVKKITIEPSGEKKRFGIDFTELFHGTNTMVIRDDEGNAVKNAIVSVNAQSYVSDENGVVTFYVRAGETNISVEKPGFNSRKVQISIKPKIIRFFKDFLG